MDKKIMRGNMRLYRDLKSKNLKYVQYGRMLRRIPNLTYNEFKISVKNLNGSVPWHIIKYMYHDYLTYQDEEIYNEYSQLYL